ncbi:hypothetical protein EVAR_17455_1 [Eumeta japonica]|uniref:Uncharacterized protein n=1 Tax=Eumeta variegata TaxID=151549 RepID=A0A4C1VA52_EUMVA|nr:hypothetical protein EVAR_17455_1 [Eumeta japonica]
MWEGTCVDTLVVCYLNNISRAAASGTESAAKQKHLKYSILKDAYLIISVACETAGRWGSEVKSFIRDFGRRLRDKGGDPVLGLIYSKPYLSPSKAAMLLG